MRLPMKINGDAAALAGGPALVLLSVASAYALHPYVALLAIFASAAALFLVSGRASRGGIAQVAGYSCAFACLVLAAGLVSGEIGMKPCPDRVANPGAGVRISYFYSPFCPRCLAQDAELEEFLLGNTEAEVRWYDMRYCRDEAAVHSFTGMPCFAIEKGGMVERHCGATGSEELAAMIGAAG